jgi:hypothetical protein
VEAHRVFACRISWPEPASTRSETSMDNAARTRRRVLALFLPVAAVLYIGGEAVSPKGTDQVIATTAVAFKVLPIAAQHQTQLYLASALVLLGLGTLAVSYGAIATLVRGRGSALATVAALLGGLGAFCGVLVNVVVYPTLAATAAAPVSRGAAANLLVTVSNSEFGQVFSYVYFASEFLAPLLMGIALWRSRAVPRWLAALFFVGLLVAELMESYGPIVILYMLPFAAAMVLLAIRIWQSGTVQDDRSRTLEPASVPA